MSTMPTMPTYAKTAGIAAKQSLKNSLNVLRIQVWLLNRDGGCVHVIQLLIVIRRSATATTLALRLLRGTAISEPIACALNS